MSTVPLGPEGLPLGHPFRPDWEVTPRQTRDALAARTPGLILLDCRRPEEWQACRIEGAVHIPMNDLERRADELEDDEGGRSHPIIVYCHHGNRSLRVAAFLRQVGYPDVKSMAGGIDLWSVDIDRAVPRY